MHKRSPGSVHASAVVVILTAALISTLPHASAAADLAAGGDATRPSPRRTQAPYDAAERRRLQPVWGQNGPINLAAAEKAASPSPGVPLYAPAFRAPRAAVPSVPRRPQWGKRLLHGGGGSGGGGSSSSSSSGGGGSSSGPGGGGDGGTQPRRRRMLQQRSGRCVCAFDFDHTLRVERDGRQDAAALDAKGIVSDCKSKGYAVAIASANDDVSKIAPVLGRVDGSTFNDGFYKTSAFQVGQADKSQELRRIAEWYRTPAECIMLFDDSWFNKKYADETGAVWRRVSGSSGVRWRDYEQARKDLQRQCDCR